MLNEENIRQILHYDPESGFFIWKAPKMKFYQGKRAGCVAVNGYRKIRLFGVLYSEHRLAFLYMTGEWPPHEVDHVNRVKDDNRWVNLRKATNSQNQANKGKQKNNSSGHKGVSWCARSKKWIVQIKIQGKSRYLGLFSNISEAAAAYEQSAACNFGEYFGGSHNS